MKNKNNGCLGWLSAFFVSLLIFVAIGFVSCIDQRAKENISEKIAENAEEVQSEMKTDELQDEVVKNITTEKKKVYSKNNVTICVTGYDDKEKTFDFFVKNKSNLNLGFNSHAYSVNGIMTKNNIYDMDFDVATKKKTNTELKIDKTFLEENDISEIKYIDILFWAYDNDKSYKEFDTGVIRIKTSAYEKEKISVDGKKIYDKNGIKIKYLGNDGKSFNFSAINQSEQYIEFDVNNISINGFTSSDTDFDLVGILLFDENVVYFSITPENEFLYNNGIKEIKKAEFNLAIRPKADYFKEYNTKTISTK